MRRSDLLGQVVSDWQGERLGRVIDTWPFDGGGEPDLAVLRMARLGGRRMVPVAGLEWVVGELRLPFAAWQVEDSPPFGEDRHTLDDDPWCSLSYWRWEEPVLASLGARWHASSGFSAMARRFPTAPSRTPIES